MAIWDIIVGPILKIIDKVVPDRAAADAAKAQLQVMVAQGQLTEELEQLKAVTTAQSDINKVEAASTNWFVAGGRPAIMWICGLALFSDFLIRPYMTAFTHIAIPVLDMNELMPLLFGMLGLGTMRTWEKVKGVAGSH
jgi:hypothetical protein